MIAACIPLELKRGHVTAPRSIPLVDFSEPSAIDMEAQVNVSQQLRDCRQKTFEFLSRLYLLWGEGVCITASGNNALKLFMASLETIEPLIF